VRLSWDSGRTSLDAKVYFGTDPNPLNNTSIDLDVEAGGYQNWNLSPPFLKEDAYSVNLNVNLTGLSPGQWYYWQVKEIDCQTEELSPVYKFKTGSN